MNYCYCEPPKGTLPYADATYFLPENGLMPEDQARTVMDLVAKHAKAGTSFAVRTVSPYVLKAVETYCDAYEQDVTFLDEYCMPVRFQDLMKKFYEPFGLMMHGPNWKPEANF